MLVSLEVSPGDGYYGGLGRGLGGGGFRVSFELVKEIVGRGPAKSNGCGSSGRTSRGPGKGTVEVAGSVDSALFLGEVPGPVGVEIAVAA